MKKILSILFLLILLTSIIFTSNSYAAALNTINVDTNKTTVEPGQEVKVLVDFGQSLGTYTIKVSYDDNIFDYVSAEGGTANNTGDKVNVVFHDTTGGTSPRNNMSVTFKAKDNITTSNPTEFTVVAEGLANADASVTLDDITTPIVKNLTVEPQYVDYKIKLDRPQNIIKGKETEMTIEYSSSMGRYYEHARLIGEVTTPTGATAKLLGTDQAGLEHDIIQSGWGDAQGYKIGGKDVMQRLKVKGLFSEVGTYTITLSLIDRDNSDKAIASSTFLVNVSNEQTAPEEPTTQPPQTTTQTENNNQVVNAVKTPTKLPKTGSNIYIPIILVMIVLVVIYAYQNRKNQDR